MNKKSLLENIKCPHCGKPHTWHHDNPYRPFCSKRCRLIDLGEWIEEKKKLPGGPTAPSEPSTDEDS